MSQLTGNRRLGRLLNVLCMFNLRPVSTGEFDKYATNSVMVFGKYYNYLSIPFHHGPNLSSQLFKIHS